MSYFFVRSRTRRAPQVFGFSLLLLLLACAALSGCATSPPAYAPADLQKLDVIVDGHTFALWSRPIQNPKGVIVLLHGRTWSALPDFDLQVPGQKRSVMRALNERGYTTYALDMRGYGATARDASGWLTPRRAAADLAGVLEWIHAREEQPLSLVGWSMGALVSHLAVQDHALPVTNLILFGYPRDPATVTPIAQTPPAPPREPNTRERAASDFISPQVTPASVIEAYVQAALASDPVRVDWKSLEEFNALQPSRIHVPTLLLHGERDPLTPAAAQSRLFTQLGTADKQWIVLPGGDHAALIEDTLPAFIAAIVAFVERPPIPADTY